MNETLHLKSNEMPYAINEDFKLLRTHLQFLGEDKKVLLFTSTIAGEGKSTVSFELARSLTAIQKKVLFMDCDLRKSTLYKRIEEPTNFSEIEQGMSHYLSSQCEMEDVIYPTNTEGLDIIVSGPFPPNPSELLSHTRLKVLLDTCREVYDYIIIDTAPVGLVTDSSVIAPHCDGIILIMETDKIRFRMAQSIKKRLDATQCPILGVILNKVQKGTGPYYYYNNKYYYYTSNKQKGILGKLGDLFKKK